MSDKVRVYVNATPLDVDAAATAIQAVEAYDPAEAALVLNGEKRLTDSRGISTAPDAPVHNGAIFRVVRVRPPAGDDKDPGSPS